MQLQCTLQSAASRCSPHELASSVARPYTHEGTITSANPRQSVTGLRSLLAGGYSVNTPGN